MDSWWLVFAWLTSNSDALAGVALEAGKGLVALGTLGAALWAVKQSKDATDATKHIPLEVVEKQAEAARDHLDMENELRTKAWLREQRFETYARYLEEASHLHFITVKAIRKRQKIQGEAALREFQQSGIGSEINASAKRTLDAAIQISMVGDRALASSARFWVTEVTNIASRVGMDPNAPSASDADVARDWLQYLKDAIRKSLGILPPEEHDMHERDKMRFYLAEAELFAKYNGPGSAENPRPVDPRMEDAG